MAYNKRVVKPAFTSDQELSVLKLYPKKSATAIAKGFGVSTPVVTRLLKRHGVDVRPRNKFGCKERFCACGKPAYRRDKCKFHYGIRNANRCKRYRQRKDLSAQGFIRPMQAQICSIAAEIGDVIGIETEYAHGYQYVMFYWQAASVRRPREERFLGRIPAKYQVKAVTELVGVLRQIRSNLAISQSIREDKKSA